MICLKAVPLLFLFAGCLAEISTDDLFLNNRFIEKFNEIQEAADITEFDNDNEYGILKGGKTDINHHPYQVVVKFHGKVTGSGVIVNEQFVLTTALTPYVTKHISVSVGQSQLSKAKDNLAVEKIILHPKYNLGTAYAVSLLKLKKPLKFSKSVKAIKVATHSPKEGSVALVSGWGLKSLKPYKPSNDLLQTHQTVLSNKDCKPHYYASVIAETTFCAQRTEQRRPTYFDEGDPLVENDKLVGIFLEDFSHPILCKTTHKCPSIYTDVAKLNSWIHHTIKQHEE